jgi:hypothetical protein
VGIRDWSTNSTWKLTEIYILWLNVSSGDSDLGLTSLSARYSEGPLFRRLGFGWVWHGGSGPVGLLPHRHFPTYPFAKGHITLHGFAVHKLAICWWLAAELLATQRICLQHVCSKSPACCRLTVDLSVLNHIQRIYWRHNGFVYNISDAWRCCRQIRWWQNVVDLL